MDRKPLRLRYYGDPILRKKAEPVASVTPEIRELIAGLFDTMYRERGVGLAAPQVGASQRIFVVDVEGEEGARTKLALVNPTLVLSTGSVVAEEGCLSIPGIHADGASPSAPKGSWLGRSSTSWTTSTVSSSSTG